jgi:hypothetical protein
MISGAIAAGANVLLLYAAQGLGVSLLMPNPSDPSGAYQPMLWFFPASLSLLSGLVAPAVLALCQRAASKRPLMAFRIVAAIVLVLSFAGPLFLPAQVDLATKITLNLMHVVAAIPIIAIVKPHTKEGL